MSNNPNEGYYQHSSGSLTGFDDVILPNDTPNIVETGWSIDQLKAFLLNEFGGSFATNEFAFRVNEMVNAHINDFNNPHRLTLNQIVANFVEGVLTNITPGTPPDIAPFYSFDAVYALPFKDVLTATYTTANFYRMSDGGILVDPSTEIVNVGTDYSARNAGVPLFSSVLSLTPVDWYTKATSFVNTTIANVTIPQPTYPLIGYTIAEQDAVGSFGVAIPVDETPGVAHTATFFVTPADIGGFITVSRPGDTTNVMVVDLDSGEFTLSSNTIMGATYIQSNGDIRVSFMYQAKTPTADNFVHVLHRNLGEPTTVRQGQPGRVIFTIAQAYASKAALNQPVKINVGTNSTNSAVKFDMSKMLIPASIPNLMVTVALDLYPMLPSAVLTDTVIMKFGTLTLERDRTRVYVKSEGLIVCAGDIIPGHNVFSLSYSPTTISLKDIKNPRTSGTGTFPILSSLSVLAGPCGGYLKYIAFYAQADNANCLEFLSNG